MYNTPAYLYGSSTNAIKYLLFLLRQKSYKHTKDAHLTDKILKLNYISTFDRHLNVCFNPLVKVAATQEQQALNGNQQIVISTTYLKRKLKKLTK